MAKLIDKTPRNLFPLGYRRIAPISLDALEDYLVIGVNLPEEKPCLYSLSEENQSPEFLIMKRDRDFYAGDISTGRFYPQGDARNYLLAIKKRLPLPLTKRGKSLATAQVHAREAFLKKATHVLPNILKTPYFEARFKEKRGDLALEEAIYAPSKQIWVGGRKVSIGFEEWEMRIDYLFNHFLKEQKEENRAALMAQEAVYKLKDRDIIEFHPGFRFQFRTQ